MLEYLLLWYCLLHERPSVWWYVVSYKLPYSCHDWYPPKIDIFLNDIIRKSVKSCLQELSTACHDCQLWSRRRPMNDRFYHHRRVKKFRVSGECAGRTPFFGPGSKLLCNYLTPGVTSSQTLSSKIVWVPRSRETVVRQNSRWSQYILRLPLGVLEP